MMRIKNIVIFLLILSGNELTAQTLLGIPENSVIKNHRLAGLPRLKSAMDEPLLTLPFFEDFSYTDIYPDAHKWADQYTFINTSFPSDPPSLGVATLDAIDEHGNVYAISDVPTSSDRLTSHPFDLSGYTQPGDTVRLSFFYQCGGLGEVPEMEDSLLLEFYAPEKQSWFKAWSATIDTATPFRQVILAIPGSFYQNGFRFRFRNYTSMSADQVAGGQGALSNVDCWNIDYILMNTDPPATHEFIPDIALVEPPRYLMDFYESVPWLHLNDAQSITRNYLRYVFRNLEKNEIINLGRNYYTKNLGTGYTELAEAFFDNFEQEDVIRRNDPFMTPFTRSDNSDQGSFEVGGFLITPETQFKQNDTARTLLHFKDYYAYDDGTPEYGFGISGPSMAGALLACRFRVYKPDTLRALDIFFNKARNNYNATLPFNLCVWADDSGKPGELLYISPDTYTPVFTSGISTFHRYALNEDTGLVIQDTVVYVGMKQVTEEFINLGYDVNRNNLERTFINTSGEWFAPGSSILPGTLMIRAVFGSKEVLTGESPLPATDATVILFPNPVSDILHIQSTGIRLSRLRLYDVQGRLTLEEADNIEYLDVSGLPSGLYQVILYAESNQIITGKIIIHH